MLSTPLRRAISWMAALVLAGGIAAAGATGAQAADDDTWGYTSTPKAADGSLDFSGWDSRGYLIAGTRLGSLNFTRNGIDFSVRVNAPTARQLLANTIVLTATDRSWTYTFYYGTGQTSFLYYTNPSTGAPTFYGPDIESYYTLSRPDALAVAFTGDAVVSGQPIKYSEVLDVTSDGRLVHHITITNVGTETIRNGFGAMIDTMLNSNDHIPIVADGPDSVYIGTSQFRLYLQKLTGDKLSVGDWTDRWSLHTSAYRDPSRYARGTTIIDGVDTAVTHSINPADLAPGKSVTLAFEERLYAPEELGQATIRYVDDDLDGAAVTPKEGTPSVLEGTVGSPTGFTEDDARAGVPDGYVFASLENAATFTGPDQTITVHLTHHRTVTSMTTTRTINYTGAETNPADVVQTIDWEVATDDVTGAISYSNTTGYPAVPSPTIEGYTADPETVPAVAPVTGGETRPTDETATVTYTPAAAKVTVTFDANGGTTPTASVTVDKGSPVGTLPMPTRAGFSFVGWADDAGADFTETTVVDADMTVHAQWVAAESPATDTGPGTGGGPVGAGGRPWTPTTAIFDAVSYLLVAGVLFYAHRWRAAYSPRRAID